MVWAGEEEGEEEEGESGIREVAGLAASKEYNNFSFGWMNWYVYKM